MDKPFNRMMEIHALSDSNDYGDQELEHFVVHMDLGANMLSTHLHFKL
jgi:hypothetical protein